MLYDAKTIYTSSTLGDSGYGAVHIVQPPPFERYSPPQIDTHGVLDSNVHTIGSNGSLPAYSLRLSSSPQSSLHSGVSSYLALPSNWDGSNWEDPSYVFQQNFFEGFSSQSPASIVDPYERQKVPTGRDPMRRVEVHVPLQSDPYKHAPSNVNMPTRFDVPLTKSGVGLIRDANPRDRSAYYLEGWNQWVGLSEVQNYHLHPPHTPPHEGIHAARLFLDHTPTPHPQLTSPNECFRPASDPTWRSRTIPGTTSGSIGDIPVSSIAELRLSLFGTSNIPSEATPDLMVHEQKIPQVAFQTVRSRKQVQSDDLTRARRRGAANRSLDTVSNSSRRSTKALPYQRDRCKKNLSYCPEYLRVALSTLLKIVAQSVFVSQNVLEPMVGSDVAKDILKEVYDRTGVWLGDKASEGESIYFLFIDRTSNLSLICGHNARTSDRALGHIRSMLDHRPFSCLGRTHGCNCRKCSSSGDRLSRFFTETLRDDHIRRQGIKDGCTTCGVMIRRGGMNRHVRLNHPETGPTPVPGEEGFCEEIS